MPLEGKWALSTLHGDVLGALRMKKALWAVEGPAASPTLSWQWPCGGRWALTEEGQSAQSGCRVGREWGRGGWGRSCQEADLEVLWWVVAEELGESSAVSPG